MSVPEIFSLSGSKQRTKEEQRKWKLQKGLGKGNGQGTRKWQLLYYWGFDIRDDYQDHSCIHEQAVSIGMPDFWLLDLGSEVLAGFVTCCSI